MNPLEEWANGVARVTEFSFNLDRPNPHYHDDEWVESVIEDLRLRVARISGKAREGESLDLEDTKFQQMLDHVRRDYGRGVVRGIDYAEDESEWISAQGGTVPAKKVFEVEAETDEVPEGTLLEALSSPPKRIRLLEPGDLDDETT